VNCHRNLPSYGRWQKRFAKQGVVMVGVHTPETAAEKVAANVEKDVRERGISYPVLLDQKAENWRRWGQQYWPTVYLVDRWGRVRYAWVGELGYEGAKGEETIAGLVEELLKEHD
jgi:hypothetical protein